ncbi:N-acetylmuramoyl-L-alanine amidase [Streptomyces sp. MS06]|uniref:N-acetylmuramoyl-L-alanine amidase n=1 Tax=Streptomyces sp. MS06 TaxID=3385974 RepID=UPI0039A258A7
MAWYPGAEKMELQPESDAQPAIVPDQFIVHSIVAPWTPERTYEYWRDSTNLESHFGLGYDGSLGQYIGTQTRADANAAANRRANGHGAVSLESASNLQASDPWTDAQVETLIRLGVWLHQRHAIPLRICRSWDDPGYGYHRMFTEWNPNDHSCPGDARVAQFHAVVFPGIVARATGKTTQEDAMSLTDAQANQLDELHKVLVPYMGWQYVSYTEGKKPHPRDAYAYLRDTNALAAGIAAKVSAQGQTIDQLVKTVAQLASGLGDLDPAAIVAELKASIEAITVHLDVPDTTAQ